MNRSERLKLVTDTGIIAIMRAKKVPASQARTSEHLIAAAEAICRGGVRAIEVTMTTPGALEVIAEASARLGRGVLFGAGTVLDAETAQAAIQAGAGLIVSPTLDVDVIRLCNDHGVVAVPGCYTPTEMLAAFNAGADLCKFFPAEIGGPAMLRAIRAPLPQLRIVPVGGVTLDNAAEYMRSGAAALGIGSALIDQALLDAGDLAELARRAAAFIAAVKTARGD
jgi:2-dehydro-3-deoxyphosphogluconate aldolase/(4S)-4-hydroxy-2-oxoglutarate aldolase